MQLLRISELRGEYKLNMFSNWKKSQTLLLLCILFCNCHYFLTSYWFCSRLSQVWNYLTKIWWCDLISCNVSFPTWNGMDCLVGWILDFWTNHWCIYMVDICFVFSCSYFAYCFPLFYTNLRLGNLPPMRSHNSHNGVSSSFKYANIIK